MQTFLPYSDFKKSAKVLDNKRLGKQRVECFQILKALTAENYGWKNHPAVKMWKGFEGALVEYSISICEEWISRGFKDTMLERFKVYNFENKKLPPFVGNKDFHLSHQSNLVRKDENYRKYFGNISNDLEYVWIY
jgi:hypothetical protein